MFSGWLALLIAQVALVGTGHLRLHRRLGIAGAALTAAVFALGVTASLVAARRPGGFIGVPMPPLEFLAIPLFDMLLFGALAALGIARRRHPRSHKRLMLLAALNLVEAAVVRIPGLAAFEEHPLRSSWLADGFLLPLIAWDLYALRRLHPATLWGGALIVASQPLRCWICDTAPWLAFAGWAVGRTG